MPDVRARFATLNDVPARLDWADVERRVAQAAGASASRIGSPVIGQPTTDPTGRVRSGSRTGPWSFPLWAAAVLVLAAILVAVAGLALVGGRPLRARVELPAAISSTGPSTAVEPSATTASGEAACPTVDPGTDVRIVDLKVPRIGTGVVGEPRLLACSIYVTSGANNGGINRIDAVTGALSSFVPAEIVSDIETTGADLWALDSPAILGGDAHGTLDRLDPQTGVILRRIRLAQSASTFRIVDGRVWLSGRATTLPVIDLASGETVASIPLAASGPLLVDDSAVWARVAGRSLSLARIDRATFAVSIVPLPPSVIGVGLAGGRIYVVTDGLQVLGLDPTTGRILSTTQLGGETRGEVNLAAAGSRVWVQPVEIVPNGSEFRLVASEIDEIDPATGQVIRRIDYPSSQPLGLSADPAHLWASDVEHPVVEIVAPAG